MKLNKNLYFNYLKNYEEILFKFLKENKYIEKLQFY